MPLPLLLSQSLKYPSSPTLQAHSLPPELIPNQVLPSSSLPMTSPILKNCKVGVETKLAADQGAPNAKYKYYAAVGAGALPLIHFLKTLDPLNKDTIYVEAGTDGSVCCGWIDLPCASLSVTHDPPTTTAAATPIVSLNVGLRIVELSVHSPRLRTLLTSTETARLRLSLHQNRVEIMVSVQMKSSV